MEISFWVWIAVFVISIIVEAVSLEMISIWFALGAILPMILSATKLVGWEIQLIIFIVISAVLILCLRKITLKVLFKNANTKTNKDSLIGLHVRMLERTDFETLGSVKINDIIWSAVEINRDTIEKDELVEIVSIAGNKLKVKALGKLESKQESTTKESDKTTLTNTKNTSSKTTTKKTMEKSAGTKSKTNTTKQK